MTLISDPDIRASFEALIQSYSELLVGDSSPETVEQVKLWAIYSHIHKTMPAMANHWNAAHPEGKQAVRELFQHIKAMNEAKNASKSNPAADTEPKE